MYSVIMKIFSILKTNKQKGEKTEEKKKEKKLEERFCITLRV